MSALKLQLHVSMDLMQNHVNHRTEGLQSDSLVVRRGQPFQLSLLFNRPDITKRNEMKLVLQLGTDIQNDIPVIFERVYFPNQWCAYYENMPDPLQVCVHVFSPANATVAVYTLSLLLRSSSEEYGFMVGNFTLLCNPWCSADSVFLPDESQREEYVRKDFGVLYQGTVENIIYRPWCFDLYENEILEICMRILCVSPEYLKNKNTDFAGRKNPIYISRVVSSMINSNDDLGVLDGKWSDNFRDGVNPSTWTGSGNILKQWARSGCKPVKYGQCWVFAAVMCTVMRVLGIPTRVVTNYNSGHDTNANAVIEEYYTEKGEKIPGDSIWNFHVWVESWMKRGDLTGFDGWQVLDPTPQERSEGMFKCGPAPVKAIRECQVDILYDVPFIYAEVNASVQVNICRGKQVLSHIVEKNRLGTLICTKSLGSCEPKDITASYKNKGIAVSQHLSRRSSFISQSSSRRSSFRSQSFTLRPKIAMNSEGLSVQLIISKAFVGESICFMVIIRNNSSLPREVMKHVNAQAKSYNSVLFTFYEEQISIQIAANEELTIPHQIPYSRCAGLGNEHLVNLAVVVADLKTHERILAFEEFNISYPSIEIQLLYRKSIITHTKQVAIVNFTNPFLVDITGLLTVTGSSMHEGKTILSYPIKHLQPKQSTHVRVNFTPKMAGEKMIHATLKLINNSTVFRGFTTFIVQQA